MSEKNNSTISRLSAITTIFLSYHDFSVFVRIQCDSTHVVTNVHLIAINVHQNKKRLVENLLVPCARETYALSTYLRNERTNYVTV